VKDLHKKLYQWSGLYYLYQAPSIVIYTFLFMFFIFGIVNDEEDLGVRVRRIDRFLFLFIFLAVIILIYTALYVGFTPVGSPIIGGVQGRYLIPIAVFFFLSLSDRKIINKNNKVNFLVYNVNSLWNVCFVTKVLC
jgi:uncharacterized membrane protein